MFGLSWLVAALTLLPRLLHDLDDPVGVRQVVPPRLLPQYDFIGM